MSRRRGLELGALALGLAGALALWLAHPVDPSFDSEWSLVWGQEVWRGGLPSFGAYRVPTEHPLWVAVCTLLVPLGSDAAPRALTLLGVGCWVGLGAGLYRLGRASLGAGAGAVAVVLLASRLNYGFWALSGFVDLPFLAGLVWAAALEAERPRRGGVVWVLIGLAGLLRPEAWLWGIAYAVWMAWPQRTDPRAWLRVGVLAAVPIVLWGLTDLVVTGDPTYSFTRTVDEAATLGRNRGLLDLPEATLRSAREVVKGPVLALGVAGLTLLWVTRRRVARPAVPVAALVLGVLGFLAVSATGFSVIPRYFATAGVAVTLLAAYALTGWMGLPAGRGRTTWAAVAAVAVVGGGAYQLTHLHPASVTRDLAYREQVGNALRAALDDPAARAARACGPTSVPDHLLQPLALWHLDAPVDEVVARSDTRLPEATGGVAIVTLTRRLNHHPAFGPLNPRVGDPSTVLLWPPGFERATQGRLIAAWTRCA